jgi:hypothetical protein
MMEFAAFPFTESKVFISHPPRRWKDWSCAECSTNITPQRRAGPGGINSLCNACGLKYFKKVHQEQSRLREEKLSILRRMSITAVVNAEDDDSLTGFT